MASRKHLVAVNRTIKSAGLDENGVDSMLVEFLRDLARRMDSAGPDGPPLNLVRAYQSAYKDVARASNRTAARKPPEPPTTTPQQGEGAPQLHIVEESPLEQLRNKKKAVG